jgi:hypothetical protein
MRLRIANTQYGAVEISLDGGTSWRLVARVARPASAPATGASSDLATVHRTSPHGMAFGIGGGRMLRVVPEGAASAPGAIVLNLPARALFFSELLPASGTPVQLVMRGRQLALPRDYTPMDGDVFLFIASTMPTSSISLEDRVRDAAERYLELALARLKARGHQPTKGALTVTARLAEGETPKAVLFLIDGQVRAFLNRAPYTVRLDSREWPNGEHLLEARALDDNGVILTSARTLIVVQNEKP